MADAKMYSRDWWMNQIDRDEKRLREGWWIHADKIIKRYLNKKENDQDQFWLDIFWANVGVLKAALYARPPRPMVERVWEDMNDNVGRVASLILERCLGYDLMKNGSPMDKAIKMAVEDWLIPGMGLVWLRYASEVETETVPGTNLTFEYIAEEDVVCEYVHWRDIVIPSARTEDDVWYIARKVYLTPKGFKDRFGVTIDKDANDQAENPDNSLPKNFTDGKVSAYEIWCKRTRKIHWVSRDVPKLDEHREDILGLEQFYPCPMPLMATHTTSDYIPRPDYIMCKDQYDQLNDLNTRITILERALRVVGVYDKKNAEVARMLSDARENDMIPVDKWAVLQENGGVRGSVDWFPLDQIAGVLEKLKEQMADKKAEIYELTGISDIMRGQTNARETATSQKMKAAYSSVRLQYKQNELAQFVRQILVLKAEIICKHFQDHSIRQLSNIDQTVDAAVVPQALALLRDSEMTEYRISISEESLALPDYQQEQASRTEFLTTVGQFLSQAAPMTEAVPASLPYMLQIMRWVASGLRGSQEIQGIFDQMFSAVQANPPQKPPAAQPDTTGLQQEQIRQQAETQRIQIKTQAEGNLETHKAQLAAHLKEHDTKLEIQKATVLEQLKNQSQHSLENRKAMNAQAQATHQHIHDQERARNDADLQLAMQSMQPSE